jgi:protein-S-isoprenylcysteine O-methyltransferase Ste14
MKVKFFLRVFISSLVFSGILFLSAGTFDYFNGWIFLYTNLITSFMNFWSIKDNPELMTERTQVGDGAKTWDKKILGISALVYVVNVVVAGMDSGRYHWSPELPMRFIGIGIVCTFIGQIIFLSARKENHFFSSVVRIQTERAHSVCDTGLYQFVRHPGYLGMSISLLSIPLITGSLWSAIPTGIAVVLLIIRTYLEDETLKEELPGYTDYVRKTKRRLIPYIW